MTTVTAGPVADATDECQHRRTLTESGEGYTVAVGGTVDGESMRDPVGYGNYAQAWENNLWVRMENTGDEAVVNPWIRVDGRRRWRSVEEILEDLLDQDMSEADKARAIWEFARGHRFHFTSADDEVKDTVKMLNAYGYTLCWDEAYTVSNLWQAAGLKIRRGLPHGHCTTEVWFDGKYHLLDSDEHLLVLERDNETIAGEAELSRDHDLMKRSHCYGVLSREDRSRSEGAASLFLHTGPRSGTRPFIGGHRMDLTLRPGEALVWGWDESGRWRGYGDAPPRFCNGRLEWTPPLDADLGRWAQQAEGMHAEAAGVIAGGEGAVAWALAAPYPVVGGSVELTLSGSPVSLQLRRDGGEWIDVADALAGECRVELDEHFTPSSPATYACGLRLSGSDFTLGALRVVLHLQMAPLSLPGLRVGDNTVDYTDESTSRQVEITHAWRERDDLEPPAAPFTLSPADGDAVSDAAPTLCWRDTAGDGGDYHVRLGTDPELRWVLSPVFEKLVSRTPSEGRAEWSVPEEGLLNPETDYFWQVRARSGDGVWGPWSATARFRLQAPGVPLDVTFDMDWERRRGILRWRPNPAGSTPASYEIHGSEERGFSARREDHTIVAGQSEPDHRRSMPANLLFTVDAGCDRVAVLGCEVETGNRAFYRVVAVDGDGVRSGPSDFVEAPRPFVYTELPARVRAGEVTSLPLQAVHSIGDLRAESRGPRRYHTEFRDGDDLTWVLDEGPDWIELDGGSGSLTFRPQAHDVSTHTVTVRVKNGQGGVDVVGFDLEVVP